MKQPNMKSAKFLNLMVLGLVLTLPFAGCRKNPRGITPLPGQRTGPIGDMPPSKPFDPAENLPKVSETGIDPTDPHKYDNYKQDREIFKAQTVYFDFDSAVVKGSEKAKADTVAAHLAANPSHAVKVEGHCDERGTEEYNRSLGERRALAVREQLVAAGVAPDRIVTISFGEDKPAVSGHDEAAYRQNRRGEFILLTPP
jgi:peptidoglycan-associated lipoprotein